MSRTCTRCGATLDGIPFGPIREEWCAACWGAASFESTELRDEEWELEQEYVRIYQAQESAGTGQRADLPGEWRER